MGTSVLHIKTEVECNVFLFDESKGIAKPGCYFNIEVRKGEQDLLLMSTSNDSIQCHLKYQVEESDFDYRLNISEEMFSPIEQYSMPNEDLSVTAKPTKAEIDNGIVDEYGVVYSRDGEQLLLATNSQLGHYVVKRGCKIIRDFAFSHRSKLKSVGFPDGLTHIGSSSFEGCSEIHDLYLPTSLKYIGHRAFRECRKLWGVEIQSNLQFIGEAAFAESNIGMFNIDLREGYDNPNYIISPEGFLIDVKRKKLLAAFSRCYYSGYNEVEYITFEGDEVVLPDGLMQIGEEAFNTSIKYCLKIILPDSITYIGDKAFSGCNNLTRIVFPSQLTHIGDRAFAFCSNLSSIILPDGLKHIGDAAFMHCRKLAVIEIRPSVISDLYLLRNASCYHWWSSDGYCAKNLLPTRLTFIGDSAFFGCIQLHDITLPYLEHIGEGAFSHTGIVAKNAHAPLADSFQLFKYTNGCLVDANKNKLIAFFPQEDDTVMQEVSIPEGVTEIGHDTFLFCKSVSKITIPNSIKLIGKDAFGYCDNLSVIAVPDGTRDLFLSLLPKDLHDKVREVSK